MEISIHLRGGDHITDSRSLALAEGLSWLPHTVTLRNKTESPRNADLVIQNSFASSVSIEEAVDRGIPYILMEGPLFRTMYGLYEASTFTYNGLQAGGTRPKVPNKPRIKPILHDLRTEGPTMILGQKPNDRSLRGMDHVEWLKEKLVEYPDAIFRHNPIMVPEGNLEPIGDALANVGRTVSYTSTASVDSVFAGCKTICEHPANEAYSCGENREEWAHRVSWYNLTHEELATDDIAAWILTGYDKALNDATAGRQERPRPRVDGKSLASVYYAEFPIVGGGIYG